MTRDSLSPTLNLSQAFPTTIKHKYGTTTLEAPPKRIVAVGLTDQDPLFALGEQPLAVWHWYGDFPNSVFPWAEYAADGATPEEINKKKFDYEKVRDLHPDLIIAAYSDLTPVKYERLSQIAPTLAQSGNYLAWTTPWQVLTQDIGAILGKAEGAETRVARVEERLAAVREKYLEHKDIEVAVYLHEYAHGTRFLFGSEGRSTQLFKGLGFVSSPPIDEALGASGGELSLERTNLLDVDLLIVFTLTQDTVEELKQKLLDDPLISQLDVIKDERVVYVTGNAAHAINFSTVLSIPYALDLVLPDLQKVVAILEPEGE